MTPAPPPGPPAPPASTIWPAFASGTGAAIVSCALDPYQLLAKLRRHADPTYIAVKVGGDDVAAPAETEHCLDVWRVAGLELGCWVYCVGPPTADVATAHSYTTLAGGRLPAFVIYDVEREYKADEGGHYEWAAELVDRHHAAMPGVAAAVTSYGGYKTTIDFASFAEAGWPIFAQCYDSFKPGDDATYTIANGGVYPSAGVHAWLRELDVHPGDAVYRPEGIDG